MIYLDKVFFHLLNIQFKGYTCLYTVTFVKILQDAELLVYLAHCAFQHACFDVVTRIGVHQAFKETFLFRIAHHGIGEGEKGKVVYRNGARETDLICVSGDLGAAYMGLQLLEREKAVLKGGDKDLQPDFSGKEYLLERQLKPEARRDIIQKLAEEGIQPTSMMDISDGLSSELLHICTQSKVGCRVYEEHIPIDYQTAVMAEEFNMNLSTCALNGGEDYELLFTVPIADHEKVAEMEGVKLIGHITKPELGCALITRDGQEFELKAQGWNPLKEEEAEKA